MKFRSLALSGLTAVTLVGGIGQAQAMNLLVAVGNPQVQVVLAEDGSLKVIESAKEQSIEVSAIEPAAGAHDISSKK